MPAWSQKTAPLSGQRRQHQRHLADKGDADGGQHEDGGAPVHYGARQEVGAIPHRGAAGVSAETGQHTVRYVTKYQYSIQTPTTYK